MAEQRNKQKLPEPSRRHWLRLPPDEDCLLAPNYQLHPAQPLQASTSSDEDDYGTYEDDCGIPRTLLLPGQHACVNSRVW